MKIENQNIYGGNQQYADIIINGSNHLSDTDQRLIESGEQIVKELIEGVDVD